MSKTFFEQKLELPAISQTVQLDIVIFDLQRYHAKFLLNLDFNLQDPSQDESEEINSKGRFDSQEGVSRFNNFIARISECYQNQVADSEKPTAIKIEVTYDRLVQSFEHKANIAPSKQNWDALIIKAKNAIHVLEQSANNLPSTQLG